MAGPISPECGCIFKGWLPDQFPDWFDFLGDGGLWAAAEVEDAPFDQGDAEVVEEGGVDFVETDWAVVGFSSLFVGGADDLAGVHATSGEEAEVGLGPMVASSLGIDFRGASKLSPADYGYIFVQTAFVEVLDE